MTDYAKLATALADAARAGEVEREVYNTLRTRLIERGEITSANDGFDAEKLRGLTERVETLAEELREINVETPELDVDGIAYDVEQNLDLSYAVQRAVENSSFDTSEIEQAEDMVRDAANEAADLAEQLNELIGTPAGS